LTLPVFFGDAGGKSSHQICESEWDQQPPAIRAELVETKSSRLRPVIGLRSYCIRQIGSLKAATGMPTGEKGCQSSPGESGRRLSPVRFGGDNWVIAAISPYFSPDYRQFSPPCRLCGGEIGTRTLVTFSHECANATVCETQAKYCMMNSLSGELA
jgi:hypothetical protein